MRYRLPSNKEIVEAIVADYHSHEFPPTSMCLNDFYTVLTHSHRIASLNFHQNREYIDYLEHFKKFIRVSNSNPDSYLRKAIDDHYRLKRFHQIL